MRIILRVLKSYDSQKIPSCFISLSHKKKAYTYAINTPAEVYNDWNYYRVSQTDHGFKAFYTRFDAAHYSGIFGLISILDGRSSLNQFQFYGCNKFLSYFSYLHHCFGIKILKMSAASFEKNDYDFIALNNKEQFATLIENYNQKKTLVQQIKALFPREDLNAAKDSIHFDDSYKLYYYEDNAIKQYAIDIFSEAPAEVQNRQSEKKFAYHIIESIEDKKGVDLERLSQDVPRKFFKMLFAKGSIQLDNKIYNLNDYQYEEENSSFLVLEILTEEELDYFLNHSYLKTDLFKTNSMILHLSPKEILENPKMTQFIQGNKQFTHLVTASGYYSQKSNYQEYSPFAFLNFNMHLNKIFPSILPQMNPHFFFAYLRGLNLRNLPIENMPFYHDNVKLAMSQEIIHLKHSQTQYQYLMPNSIQYYNDLSKELIKNNKIKQLLENLEFYQKEVKMKDQNNQYPEVITLGTSSSYSTILRNVSSYLIKTNESNSILFDCGHGTINQLRKQFGTHDEQELFKEIQKIQMIVISHHHSDHHFGLIEFLSERNYLFQKYLSAAEAKHKNNQLLLIVPNLIYNYIAPIIQMENLNVLLIPHSNASRYQVKATDKSKNWQNSQKLLAAWKHEKPDDDDNIIDFQEEDPKLVEKLNRDKDYHQSQIQERKKKLSIKNLLLFPIYHCIGSRSIKLELENGKVLVYSGDGLINHMFKDNIRGADILIHECTYQDERRAEAKYKLHSIFEDVVQFAHSLDVKCLVLSHYSSNSTEILISKHIHTPDYNYNFYQNKDLETYVNNRTIFACDHLKINDQNLKNLAFASRIIFKTQCLN